MNVRASRSVLDVAAEVLTANPAASFGEIAEAAGIGRTTLYKRCPSRHDLLLAIGHDAVSRIATSIAEVELPTFGARPEEFTPTLHRLVEALRMTPLTWRFTP